MSNNKVDDKNNEALEVYEPEIIETVEQKDQALQKKPPERMATRNFSTVLAKTVGFVVAGVEILSRLQGFFGKKNMKKGKEMDSYNKSAGARRRHRGKK